MIGTASWLKWAMRLSPPKTTTAVIAARTTPMTTEVDSPVATPIPARESLTAPVKVLACTMLKLNG